MIEAQSLNFCRQMVKQFNTNLQVPSLPALTRETLSHCVDLASSAAKFALPVGGRLIDDGQLRALDETRPLRLPYPIIAIEYRSTSDTGKRVSRLIKEHGAAEISSKRIVFAREREGHVVCTPVCFIDSAGMWGPLPEFAFPAAGYLDRSVEVDGRVAMRIKFSRFYKPEGGEVPAEDIEDEAGAVLALLNALECRNVSVAQVASRKPAKRAKAALPFDSYHVLVVDTGPVDSVTGAPVGERRSPREHLRRGHIRVYQNGLKLWINATVVNAGRNAGRVHKDYKLK